MLPFLETIALSEGQYLNLSYHEKRFRSTLRHFYDLYPTQTLSEILPDPPKKEAFFRCRLTYDLNQYQIEFIRYEFKEIKSLQCLIDDTIEYTYKRTDRTHLDTILAKKGSCDEVLIIKDGFITDLSVANILFKEGHRIVTPIKPLLLGTALCRMIDEGIVYPTEIKIDDLKRYSGWQPINALRSFDPKNWRSINHICGSIHR